MPTNILMPALSPTMTEGNLARWLKKEGDLVKTGDVIAEIETDKATMEIEAVDDGVLGQILVPAGAQKVRVNEVIGVILGEGEKAVVVDSPSVTASAPAPTSMVPRSEIAATPLARRVAGQAGVDLSGVRGTGVHGKIMCDDVTAAILGATPQAASTPTMQRASGERVSASPLARRMADSAGLAVAEIAGSGPGGRIVKRDVERSIVSAPAQSARAPKSPVAMPALPGETSTLVPLSTMRKVIAERMTHSKSTVPHFYMTVDCTIDELLRVRAELNKRAGEVKLSVNDFIIRASALALREVPAANVQWADGQMRQLHSVDISVAVAIEGGLITPIVKDADRKGLVETSLAMKDLAARARVGKLIPEEYQGGSFTISNLGMFGIKQFDAVINPPQACILAVGAGEQRPLVKDGKIEIATVMCLTLSVDHRVVDGAIGATYLNAVKRLLEYPPAMLL